MRGAAELMPTVAPLDLEGHVVGVAFLKGVPFFAEAIGAVHRLDLGHKTTEVHEGLLSLVVDEANDTLLTGGEDGKIMRTAADGTTSLVAEAPRRDQLSAPLDHALALPPSGARRVRRGDGRDRPAARRQFWPSLTRPRAH